ncbi:MAG: hypothetical protein IJ542_01760 [Clostridia bacterium]|nr:hypothetical protein [Clostridia bacterium]
MLFFKTKTKLSLIDDYIYISRVAAFYGCYMREENGQDYYKMYCQIVELCDKLKKQYMQVFLRLKMLDMSFEVLSDELQEMKEYDFAQNKQNLMKYWQEYHKNLQNLQNICELLPKKLQKLSLNPLEINYILQNAI